jgi:hypothetical protein
LDDVARRADQSQVGGFEEEEARGVEVEGPPVQLHAEVPGDVLGDPQVRDLIHEDVERLG